MPNDLPSLVRLNRVNYFLAKETKFKDKLGAMRNYEGKGRCVPFPEMVWSVAIAIQKDGKDACGMSKEEILAVADKVVFHASVSGVSDSSSAVATVAQPVEKDSLDVIADVDGGPVNLPVRLSICTLLMSAYELTRLDNKPDAEQLRKKLDSVVKDYYKGLRGAKI